MRPFIISSDSIRILASGGAIALLSMCSAALPSAPASAAEPSTTLSIQPTPQTRCQTGDDAGRVEKASGCSSLSTCVAPGCCGEPAG